MFAVSHYTSFAGKALNELKVTVAHRRKSSAADGESKSEEDTISAFTCFRHVYDDALGKIGESLGDTKQKISTSTGIIEGFSAITKKFKVLNADFEQCSIFESLFLCLPRSQMDEKEVGLLEYNYVSPAFHPARDPFLDEEMANYECEFSELLDEMQIPRQELMHLLCHVVPDHPHHPRVDELVETFQEKKELGRSEGKELLYLLVGKAVDYELERVRSDLTRAVYDHFAVQEAIASRLQATGLDHATYDELEAAVWKFCMSRRAPRNAEDLEEDLQTTLQFNALDFDDLQQIFGPAKLLVQVGPHESIKQLHTDRVRVDEEFHPVDDHVELPKSGEELCRSHWGPVHKVAGHFNEELVVKVISLSKWALKKSGIDKFNDDVAMEIQVHRYLTELNHPNIVQLHAVTMDDLNLYYYQEAGVEMFGTVDKNRHRFWSQWQRALMKKPDKWYLANKSPWEERAVQVFRGIMEGVKFLHDNKMAHRDLKLENMVVTTLPNGQLQGKLIDFGVTLRHGIWESMRDRGRIGTYPFFSPEMAYNERPEMCARAGLVIENYYSYDSAKNDVWCLGHALWGFVAGVLLWQDVSGTDNRFTVATRAQFSTHKAEWQCRRLGLRYLATRYGKERNEMMTDNLVDLLEHIFCPEDERYSMAQCLNHPWFETEMTSIPLSPALPNLPREVENIV